MVGNKSRAQFTSDNQDWCTPDWLIQRFGPFDCDVAATATNAVCAKYLGDCSLDGTDALNVNTRWPHGRLWCNPPYDKIDEFARKALAEVGGGCGTVYFLGPSRTDRPWFEQLWSHADVVYFVRRRLKFKGAKMSAPFPSVIFRLMPRDHDEFCRHARVEWIEE